MNLGLDGRVVVVVGGTGLIGSAVVRVLRAEGATVVSVARGASADLQADARDVEEVTAVFSRVLAEHGRLDGVVVAAAPSAQTLDPSRNSDPVQIVDAMDAKAMTFLRVASAAIPAMRDAEYGRVVGVSGQNAFVTGNMTGGIRNLALIVAAKNLADSVAGTGVLVNTVSPALVRPEPNPDVAIGAAGESSPGQIADLIAFLVSPLCASSGESIAVGHRVRGTLSF